MRPYYFDSDQARTRRGAAVIAFERTMHGGWPPHRRDPIGLWRSALALMRCWYERVRQRQELARLDARMLRDIGVTSTEAEREFNKPFWRA